MKLRQHQSDHSPRALRGALFAFLALGALVTALLAPSIYAFSNGQNASLVLGQTTFTGTGTGASATTMNAPRAVAIDPATGKVFVAESGNNRVLRYASLSSLANGATAEGVLGQANFTSSAANRGNFNPAANTLSNPRGLAVDAAGNLWVADQTNDRVLRFTDAASKANGANADGVLGQINFTSGMAATAQNRVDTPAGLAVDASGNLWVADSGNNRVLRFNSAASKANGANADGVLGQTNYTNGGFNTTAATMREPTDVAVEGTRLWVADSNNHRVLRFENASAKANGGSADGVLGQTGFTTRTTGTTASTQDTPFSVAVDSTGRLWVVDQGNHRVLGFDSASAKANGGAADSVLGQANFTSGNSNRGGAAGAGTLSNPAALAVSGVESLLVADRSNNRVLRHDIRLNQTITFDALGDKVYGDAPFAVSATASSGLAVTFSSTTTAVCTVSGSTVTLVAAGTCTIAADQSGNSTYGAATQVQRSFTVAKAALAVTADDQTKVYGADNPALTYAVTGLVNGDTAAATLAGELATTATAASGAGSYPITQGTLDLTTAGAANYTLGFTDGSLSVTKAALAVTADDQTKVYGEDNPALTYAVTGLVNGDTEAATLAGELATTATAASGAGSYPITQGTLDLTTAGAENYTLGFTDGSLSVTKAALAVTADDQTKVYGEDNPALTYAVTGLVNGDTAAATLAGELATTATAASGAGSYPITQGTLDLTAAGAANYTLGFTDGSLSVTKAALAVTADDQTKVYGEDNPALTYAVTGLVNGDTEAATLAGELATTATAASGVGSYPITQGTLDLTAAGAANYTLDFTDGSLDVTPATLTATAQDEVRKVGQPNPAFTILYSGFVGSDDESAITTEPTASTTADVGSPEGEYAITVSGGSADNYTFAYVAGKLTVTSKDIPTITWATPAGIVYGTALGPGQLNAAASFNGQPLAGSLSYDPPAGTVLGAGNGKVLKVTFTPADGAAYATVSAQVQIDVAKATLAVKAANKSRTYGAANPALTYTVTGLVSGDTTAATLAGSLATTATAASPVGSYAITQGTLDLTAAGSANYTLSFTQGSLSVTKASLTVRANNATRRVGEDNPAFSATITGFVNGEGRAALGGSLTFSTTATKTSPAGTYDIVPGGLTSGNYALTFVKGTLTVLEPLEAPKTIVYLPLIGR